MRLDDTGLRDQVGATKVYAAADPIGAATFRYFAQAIGDLNPRYLAADSAGRPGSGEGPVAPPTLIFETNQYTGREPDRNGYSGHAWEGIPPEAVWIRGGNEYRLGRPVRPDDRLHVTWVLTAVRDVTTRDGRSLVQMTSEAEVHSHDGDWLGWTREVMFLADPVVTHG